MQRFACGVCSASLPPCSECVSPRESAFGAFTRELLRMSSSALLGRERNIGNELLLKVKCHVTT